MKRRRHQTGAISISNRDFSILKADTLERNWERSIAARDVITSGPILLNSGKNECFPNDDFCNDRHPRTAVGKKKDGTILFFVVDGRSPSGRGMTIGELQKTMKWLSCVDALNLDGGGSSTMVIRGQPNNGVVNYPSDNKKFDHEGEREVANALVVLEK
jgi:exopolysaccharide biosynthesis protein